MWIKQLFSGDSFNTFQNEYFELSQVALRVVETLIISPPKYDEPQSCDFCFILIYWSSTSVSSSFFSLTTFEINIVCNQNGKNGSVHRSDHGSMGGQRRSREASSET